MECPIGRKRRKNIFLPPILLRFPKAAGGVQGSLSPSWVLDPIPHRLVLQGPEAPKPSLSLPCPPE